MIVSSFIKYSTCNDNRTDGSPHTSDKQNQSTGAKRESDFLITSMITDEIRIHDALVTS